MTELINHAKFTIFCLVRKTKRRSWRGKKEWEKDLLDSACKALGYSGVENGPCLKCKGIMLIDKTSRYIECMECKNQERYVPF